MLYYTDIARMSAIEAIEDCIEKIGHVSGAELSYQDARKISAFLSMLIDEIEKENRDCKIKLRYRLHGRKGK